MKRWSRHLLAVLIAALLVAGCNKAPSGTDVPTTTDESGSTLIGNPAASLKAQNLALAVKIVQQPAAGGGVPEAEPVIAGQFTLTWDPPPPPAVVASYRIERKIGAAGAWATIADVPASVREQIDSGELGATHFYRVVSFDAAGNFGVSDEISARIPTFCDYPSGWSMVWPAHGCAPFESTFALDAQTTYFAGPKLIVRKNDGILQPTYQTFDTDPHLVFKDVCAVDRDHVIAVGSFHAPREKAKGAAIAIIDGVVKRFDLAGRERGPLLRVFCFSEDRIYMVGSDATAFDCGLTSDQMSCTPIAGVDDPTLDKPYAAIWGVPGQFVITGATARSLVLVRPDAPPQPLTTRSANALDRQENDPAVTDIWSNARAVEQGGLFLATGDGLYARTYEGTLRPIDGGRWQRLWGFPPNGLYAVGDGILLFLWGPGNAVVDRPVLPTKKIVGPQLQFTSIHGTDPTRFFLTDNTGQIFMGDENGQFHPLLNIWRGALRHSNIPFDRKASAQEITAIAPVGSGLLISFRGADDGLLLFSPADGSVQPFPEFHDADVFGLTPAPGRIHIASSIGLFSMETQGNQVISKLTGEDMYTSAWDCGSEGICAVSRAFTFSPDSIVLIRPGADPDVKAIAPCHFLSHFRQAWGNPQNGLFAIAQRRIQGDALISFDGLRWNEEQLPAPPDGAEGVELRIVSAPPISAPQPQPAGEEPSAAAHPDGLLPPLPILLHRAPRERPLLLARYTVGREAIYALIAFQDGRWAEIERGDHLRPLVQVTHSGERTMGISDAPFETTSLSADGFWAVGDGKFLFRKTK